MKTKMLLLLSMLICSGCGNYKESKFFRATEMQQVTLIAVLPFENLSTTPNAEAVIGELVSKEVYRLGKFKILDRDSMIQKLSRTNKVLPSVVNRSVAVELGKALGVDAVIWGSVLEYNYINELRNGSVVAKEPAVGIYVKMADTKSGEVLWTSAYSRSSYDLLVSNRDSITRIAEKAIEDMMSVFHKLKR